MFSAKIKSIVILFLSVLAIVQTWELWFENVSNRNFFYTFLPQIFSTSSNEPSEVYKNAPSRTITNLSGSFAVTYINYEESDNAIYNALRKGSFVSSGELSWQDVLKSRSVIYEYSAIISSHALTSMFGLNSSVILSRVKNISHIILIPQRTNSEQLRLLFVDEPSNLYFEYTVDGTNLNEPLQNQIRTIQNETGNFFYISSMQYGPENFKQNMFIPRWSEDIFSYNAITPYNPYSENGDEPLLYTVEKKIDIFFDNPILKDTQKINGIYTYSTETVLVRYRQSSVLEYYSYKPTANNEASDFYSAFSAAIEFLRKDTTILNDIKLTKANLVGNAWTFYFDYSINNFPIHLSDSIKNETEMEHAIEITVANGDVKQYKRYVCAFYINLDIEINATVDFLNVINYIVEKDYPDVDYNIEALSLGYRAEKDKAMTLFWYLTVNGTKFEKSAQ